jgi:hypothetical protein
MQEQWVEGCVKGSIHIWRGVQRMGLEDSKELDMKIGFIKEDERGHFILSYQCHNNDLMATKTASGQGRGKVHVC